MKQIKFLVLLMIIFSNLTFGQDYSEQNKKCSEVLKDIKIGDDIFWEKLKLRDSCLIGLQAPHFELKTLENELFENNNLLGKVVVLNFWFTNCAPCIEEMPFLNKIVSDYKNTDVVFLSVANDDSLKLQNFLKTTKFDFKVVPYRGRVLIDTFKLFSAWPTTIIINKLGKICFINQGSLSDKEGNFKNILDKAL